YIVATDLASRGIDIDAVSHVSSAQMPKEEDFYIHRVGRTARGGLSGLAFSLYDEEDIRFIQRLEKNDVSVIESDIKDGQWKRAKRCDARQQRKKHTTSIDQEAWKQVRRPKKVKPGYKKKMKRGQLHIKHRLKSISRRKNRR